jgi:hypothetical protein
MALSLSPHRFVVSLAAPIALAAALALAPAVAFAQGPIQQQMTPQQFKAAGLDKLSPQELASLNAWLGNTIEVESQKAATKVTEEIEAFEKRELVLASLVGEFHGFGMGKQYTLDNGQVWVQTSNTELPGVHLKNPKVRIKPTLFGSGAYLSIEGYNTSATVRRLK